MSYLLIVYSVLPSFYLGKVVSPLLVRVKEPSSPLPRTPLRVD